MAAFSLLGLNFRSFTGRLVTLGASFSVLILIYIYTAPPSFLVKSPRLSFSNPDPACSPESYSNGNWVFRPRTKGTTTTTMSMTSKDDVLGFAGFAGCASSREYYWHLAADKEEQWDRFPNASSWEWVPGHDCLGLRPLDPESVIQDLVQEGGWLLVGDSVTENHFFSLSCSLYPHVIATPDYTAGGSFDRGVPQNLYLNPSSPLADSIAFPPGFDISLTPLVTFRRIDILFSKAELDALYYARHPDGFTTSDTLFSEEPVWTLPIHQYLDLFLASLPNANYGTMVVSTGGHWTTTLFSHFRDEDRKDSGYGIDGVLDFFQYAMESWAAEVQAALSKYDERRVAAKRVRKGKKKVVVRAYLPGHEDCHSARKPWKEVQPFVWNWYNWGNIWDFNARFQKVLSARDRYPNIYFLPIDRPARLRPDAHATGDCLHIMTGAGVLEGWTHYIWHFVTRETSKD